MDLKTFHGFKVIEITMLLDISNNDLYNNSSEVTRKEVIHYMYMKKDTTKNNNGRTLFLVNLPVDASQSSLERLFRRCGVVEQIIWKEKNQNNITLEDENKLLSNNRMSGTSCHLVFKDEESIDRALEMKQRKRVWHSESTGLAKYMAIHVASKPQLESLKSQVDKAMNLFAQAEREERIRKEQLLNMPDEDGFIPVTRGKKRLVDGNVIASAVKHEDAQKLQEKNRGFVDFYRFQMREQKRNELAELRRKFELDKKKIAALKQKRKFKPL